MVMAAQLREKTRINECTLYMGKMCGSELQLLETFFFNLKQKLTKYCHLFVHGDVSIKGFLDFPKCKKENIFE